MPAVHSLPAGAFAIIDQATLHHSWITASLAPLPQSTCCVIASSFALACLFFASWLGISHILLSQVSIPSCIQAQTSAIPLANLTAGVIKACNGVLSQTTVFTSHSNQGVPTSTLSLY